MGIEIGKRVNTPDGPGTIIKYDLPDSRVPRYVVKLDVSRFNYNPCYHHDEVEKI